MTKFIYVLFLLSLAPFVLCADQTSAKLVGSPKVSKDKDHVKVEFEVSDFTNVEVSILNNQNQITRHLAAGLLGQNAPQPFIKSQKRQSLVWDLKNDAGEKAKDGPFKVQVRVGLHPKFENTFGYTKNYFGGNINNITVSDKGEIYLLITKAYRGQAEMIVLNKEGEYLRTIMPFGSKVSPENLKYLEPLTIDGKQQPKIFNGQGHSVYPLVGGIRGQNMAWHPDGYLIGVSAVGSMCNHGPPRHLIAFDGNGGAPKGKNYFGPQVREARGFLGGAGEGHSHGEDSIATSPDGKWVYFVQNIFSGYFQKERKHGVVRTNWEEKTADKLWLGTDASGSGDDQFNDPVGIAVDKSGNLYVCDRGNNRVKIYSSEGKLINKFDVANPHQIVVHNATGKIYVNAKKYGKLHSLVYKNSDPVASSLLEFSPLKGSQPIKETARLDFLPKKSLVTHMNIDNTSDQLRLWISEFNYREQDKLRLATIEGNTFKLGEQVNLKSGLSFPTFIAADPDRSRLMVREHLSGANYKPWSVYNLKTSDKSNLGLNGSDIALDKDGNIYLMGGYNSNKIFRYTADGKPMPFSKTGDNTLPVPFRSYGPDMGLRGHKIAPNGDLYVRRSPNHALICTVDIFSPDGNLKKADHIKGAGSGDSGIGVDNLGNVYLGLNLKQADKPFPDDFMNQIPTDNWKYYREKDRPKGIAQLQYCNTYMFHMGSVFKFKPDGGKIYGNARRGDYEKNPDVKIESAPSDAIALKSSYNIMDVKVSGSEWQYNGVGIIPASFDAFSGDDGCTCLVSQLDTDPYGRTYAPCVFRSSIEMIDSAGNLIYRIGRFGNIDDVLASQKGSKDIYMVWPTVVDYSTSDQRVYFSDSVNRCVNVISFDYSDQQVLDVKE